MKIYFLASQKNLEAFRNHLQTKFPGVTVFGSNDYNVAVSDILRKAPTDPYDMIIFISMPAIVEDLASKGKASERLRDSLNLSLRDTPMFYIFPSSTKGLSEKIKTNFAAPNTRIFKYDGNMKMDHIESALKEALVLYEKKVVNEESIKSSVQKSIQSNQGNGYLNKTISQGVKLSDKADLLMKFITPNQTQKETISLEERTKHLDSVRSFIKTNGEELKEVSTSLSENEVPQDSNIGSLVDFDERLVEAISSENIKEVLQKSDEDYKALHETNQMVTRAIEGLKDDVEHKTDVLELYQAQADIVNKMAKFEVNYLQDVTEQINKVVEERFNSASGLAKLTYKDLKVLSDNPDIRQIERYKELRDNVVEGLKTTTKSFSSHLTRVKDTLSLTGRSYSVEISKIQQEAVEYANKTNQSYGLSIKVDSNILDTITNNYTRTVEDFKSFSNESLELMKGFSSLVHIDGKIIDSQTQVIQDLATGNVRKVISVGGILEAKSIVVVGKDGAGKTVIASALSEVYSRRGHKVLVFDLDNETPSLQYYNADQAIGYSFTVGTGNLDHKFEEGKRVAYVTNATIYEPTFKFDPEVLIEDLKANENKFDKVIYIVNETAHFLPRLQELSKATVYVTTSDVSELHHTSSLSETVLNITPLNTVVVNKCSQQMVEPVKQKLPLQVNNIAVIPCLHYGKFDYCKANQLIPYRESGGFEQTAEQIVSSIE